MSDVLYKRLDADSFIKYDPKSDSYVIVPAGRVPALKPVAQRIRMSQEAAKEDPEAEHRKACALAMLEFQHRAHEKGDPESADPYLQVLAHMARRPAGAAIKDDVGQAAPGGQEGQEPALSQPIPGQPARFSWAPMPTSRGTYGVKAVGQGEHIGRVLYGKEAQAALARGNAPGRTRPEVTRSRVKAWDLLTRAPKLTGGLSPDEIDELATHLPALPVDKLRKAKILLDASWGGQKLRKTGMLDRLMDTVRGHVEKEMQAAGITAENPDEEIEEDIPHGHPPKDPQPGRVYTVGTEHLKPDPARFQFKQKVNAAGVTKELQGVTKWNPDFAGVLSIWRDPETGIDHPVNGHHRHELATRLGVPHLNVRYLEAKDAREARAKGALINMAEGRGTALDAAKFMRDMNVDAAGIAENGVSLEGPVARDATILKKLNDHAFDRVLRGQLDEGVALAVAKHLDDPVRQEKLFSLLAKKDEEGKEPSKRAIEEMARHMAAAPTAHTEQQTLWGTEATDEDTFLERAELSGHIRNKLSQEKNDFGAVASARRGGVVGEAGNVLNVDENKKRSDQAAEHLDLFGKHAHLKGEIADALDSGAVVIKQAKNKKEKESARANTLDAIRGHLAAKSRQLRGEPPQPAGDAGGATGVDAGRAPRGGTEPPASTADREGATAADTRRGGDQQTRVASPQPELEIVRSPNLTPEEAKLEEETQRYAHANYDKISTAYLAEHATPDLSGSGFKSIVVNTDDVRPHIPGYNGVNSQATHEASSLVAKRLYSDALKSQRGKGNGKLMVLAGGGGSGKGTATREFFDQRDYPLVLDQVSGSLKKLEDKLAEAKANGFEPEYVFVDRHPEGAWDGVVGRAMGSHKKGETARTVQIDRAMTDNTHARKVALALIQKHEDIQPRILDNREGDGFRRLIKNRDEAIAYLKEQIAADAKAVHGGLRDQLAHDVALRAHAGEIPEHIAKGLLGQKEYTERTKKLKGEASDTSGVPEPESVPADDAARSGTARPAVDRRGEPGRPGETDPARQAAERAAEGGAGGTAAEGGRSAPLSKDDYVSAAMANLKKTSRTASGVVDTSASKAKADKIIEGLTPEQAAKAANDNFEGAIRKLHDVKSEQFTPKMAATLADDINREINKGITKEGVLLRTDDSAKFAYTKQKHLDLAREQFAEELASRLNDPSADPVETAAWIEWRANLTDHVWADGVGKTSKALAALALMRAGMPLPEYRDNKEFFRYASPTAYNPEDGPESYLDSDYRRFVDYYRTLMPEGSRRGKNQVETGDQLPGGKADDISPESFAPDKVAEGAAVESEHTDDPAKAEEIARDHLAEDPNYYEKLKAVEGQQQGQSDEQGQQSDLGDEGEGAPGRRVRSRKRMGGAAQGASGASVPAAGEGTRQGVQGLPPGDDGERDGARGASPVAGDSFGRGQRTGDERTASEAAVGGSTAEEVGGSGRGGQLPGSGPKTPSESVVSQPPTPDAPTDVAATSNFTYHGEGALDFVKVGRKAKYNQNLEAVRVLAQIKEEGRDTATPEEQAILSKFVGWGQFPGIFNDNADYEERNKWGKERAVLKSMLTPEEWEAAKASTLNAHFTHPDVVKAHWKIAQRLGFKGGRFLETSAGVGYYLGLIPPELSGKTKTTAVELDPTTGKMLGLLYPKANVQVSGFEEHEAPDHFYDFVASNVPFGDYHVHDPRYNKHQAEIHDYFFLKSIDKVRPGGIVQHITSKGTLDKLDPAIREELAKKVDLVAAIRFPGGAHQENAGTEVVTDMIVLRKRLPGEEPGDQSWLQTTTVPDPAGGEPITVNKYFADHPEQILGTLDRTGTMYRGQSVNVSMPGDEIKAAIRAKMNEEGRTQRTPEEEEQYRQATIQGQKDYEARLDRAIQRIPENVMSSVAAPKERFEPESVAPRSGPRVKRGGMHVEGGKVYKREQGQLVEQKGLDKKVVDRIAGNLAVRDARAAVISDELAGRDAEESRKKLNEVYDEFVKKHGHINDPKNKAFRTDPEYPAIAALEKYDRKKKTAEKADIFRKVTIAALKPAEKADSVAEGLGISLHENGNVDIEHIAKLTGHSVEHVGKSLVDEGKAFEDPSEGWQPAESYLSGNVRKKLILAKSAAAVDPKYKANVAALEKVQPEDIDHTEITARLGSPWIPPDDVAQFCGELFGTAADRFQIGYVPQTGTWSAHYSKRAQHLAHSSTATEVHGTGYANFIKILDAALNGTSIIVRYDKDEGGGVNKEATDAIKERQQALRDKFSEWVWQDDSRRDRLHRHYNDNFNNIRNTQYDGSHLQLPGKNPDMEVRGHVKNFVWQVISTGKGLAGHEVGMGKTRALVASAMELRRLGLARKPAIACLKANIEGITEEARQLYPGAKILSTADMFDAKSRKETVSKIATGDYDMVIMTHEHMNLLPMRPETTKKYILEELKELEAAIVGAKAEKGDLSDRIVKQLEKPKANLLAKLKEATDAAKKDDAVYFEETGIDHLSVDEAHMFKSLPVYSKQRVKGIPNGRSQRATNMLMRTRWLMDNNNGRGVVFATGTPVANSMTELYNMQRYLQPEELKARGIDTFDAWVNTFGDTETKIEKTVAGDYKPTTRLSKFVNLPELVQMSRQFLDVRRITDLKHPDGTLVVKRPKRSDHVVAAESTPALDSFMSGLIERAKNLDPKDPTKDNMLKICTDGRKAAIDMRMISADAEDDPNSKLNQMVQNVLQVHKDHKGGAAQLIFTDIGVNPMKLAESENADRDADLDTDADVEEETSNGFHLYNDVIEKLVAGGIPREQIADFSKLSGKAKEEAQEAMRDGRITVGIGTTQRLGTGVNVQKRVKAMHHLDCPWRPSDIEQRDGRGWRQGNMHTDAEAYEKVTGKKPDPKHLGVDVYRYVTEKSLDELNWQVIANKSKFIRQVMTPGSTVARTVSDEDTETVSPEQLMAAASGDPRILEKIQLDDDLKALKASKSRHLADQSRMQRMVGQHESNLGYFKEAAGRVQNDIAKLAERPDFELEIDGTKYTDRTEAGPALEKKIAETRDYGYGEGTHIGDYRGMSLYKVKDNVELRGEESYRTNASLQSIETVARNLNRRVAEHHGRHAETTRDLEKIKGQIGLPFPKAAVLEQKAARMAALDKEVRGGDESEKDKSTEHPHAAKSGRDLERALAEEVGKLERGDDDIRGYDRDGPPGGIDLDKLGKDISEAASTRGYAFMLPDAYKQFGKPLGLSLHDFHRALNDLQKSGKVHLIGEARGIAGLDRNQLLALMPYASRLAGAVGAPQ